MSNLDLAPPRRRSAVALPGWRTARAQGAPGPHPSGSLLAVPRPVRRTARRDRRMRALSQECARAQPAAPAGTLAQPGFRTRRCRTGRAILFVRVARFFSPRRNPGLRWALSGAVVLALCFVVCSAASRNPQSGSGRPVAEGRQGLSIASRRRQARAHHHAHRPDDARHRRGLQTAPRGKPKSRACSTPPTTIGTIR